MLDRKAAPAFVKSTSLNLIQPDRKKLPNGTDLFFICGGAQAVLKIELLFKAGRWYEPSWGIAYFTAHLLSKGTQSKNSFEIAELFDRYGAHLDIIAGLDHVSVSLYSLTKNLQPVLELLKEILQQPVFPDRELSQTKAIYIQNLKVNQEKTSFLASKYFRRSLFGDTHPYGKELEEDDIAAIQKPILVEYFNAHFKDFSIFVSGKFNAFDEALITNIFADWKRKEVNAKTIDTVPPQPFHQHIQKHDSVQSSVRVGSRSIMRKHPDFAKAVFVSHILGGYFGSRLMKNIREEKGLTYGIYASIHPLRHESYLVIGADVNKENVNLTFDEIRKELKRLRTEKITAGELETARNHFIGSLQSEISTPFAHADKIKTIYQFDLAPDYYQQMISTIGQMSPVNIIETSEKYFQEESFFEIAVG